MNEILSTVKVETRELHRALRNIIALCSFSRETETREVLPAVLITIDAHSRTLKLLGASSHIACVEEVAIVNTVEVTHSSIDVLLKNTVKTEYIDDLEKAAKAVGGTPKGKGAMTNITIAPGKYISFSVDGEIIAELPPMGIDTTMYEAVESWIRGPVKNIQAPLMLDAAILYRFKAVRAYGAPQTRPANVDLAGISEHPSGQAILFKVGETLKGVYRSIDRDSFAHGGPWGDGYGTPEALLV